MDMEIDLERYVIEKKKTDLLSSLKALNKDVVDELATDYAIDDINELKDYIIECFEDCLSFSKDDIFTKRYFESIVKDENTKKMSIYNDDISSLWAFVYRNGNGYSYYIADEIKVIIEKLLGIKKK